MPSDVFGADRFFQGGCELLRFSFDQRTHQRLNVASMLILSGTSSVSGLSIELDNRACNGWLRRFDALLEERSEDSRELLSESHEVERHEHSRQGRQLLGDSPVHSASAVPIVPFKVMKTDCGLY